MAAIAVDGVVDRSVIQKLAALTEVSGVWQVQLPEPSPNAATPESAPEALKRTP